MADGYLTFRDAAARLGVHKATIARKVNSGILPAYVGIDRRPKLVRTADIDRLLEPSPIRSIPALDRNSTNRIRN